VGLREKGGRRGGELELFDEGRSDEWQSDDGRATIFFIIFLLWRSDDGRAKIFFIIFLLWWSDDGGATTAEQRERGRSG